MAAPKTANINITVGSSEYIVSHSNFSSLSVSRTAKDVSDSFTLKILDNAAYEIEAALLSGNNYIEIKYIDDTLKVYKTLTGFAYKISSSFIDNRNMLSIEGLVGSSIKDKYQKYTFSWNSIPKFDWSSVLGVANRNVVDENYDVDSGTDQIAQSVWSFLKNLGGGLKSLVTWNLSKWDDYTDVIDRLFAKDWFSVDADGNYYVPKYFDLKDDDAEEESIVDNDTVTSDEESEKLVKSNGSYVIPMKPSKILKLICCGGKFSDLLEEEYTDYNGTAFYDEDISQAEWYYIKKWYKKMGKFSGLGYGKFKCDYDLDVVEDEFIQTRQSFMEFMYNNVLNKCIQTKDSKKYTNFYLSFDEGSGNSKGTVTLKRIDASATVTNAPQYIYYGRFKDEGENKGRMTSFSPTLDIMTSMITQGTYDSEGADISNTNLAGSTGEAEVTVSANSSSSEGRYSVNWGMVKITSSVSYTANNQLAEAEIAEIFNKAAELSYKAECTIEGFNELCPQDYIEIILLPKNEIGTPTQHHMSGVYFILSIEDTIENGRFTSKLSLIKNIQNIGNTASVATATAEAEQELKYTVTPSYSTSTTITETMIESQTNPNRTW